MDNELITEKNWWKKNWKWFIPLSGFVLIFILIINSNLSGLSDFAQTYADPSLCQNAIDEANKNNQVILRLGKLEPIDKLAIMEGNSVYSNNNKTVTATFRVSGKNGNGKMDISADKNGEKWEYKNIRIRIKKTGEEIKIIQ
ncbi:cytochrome c oxidase assembly factor Coa1 family protein [Flavobacterium pedocola]